MLDTYNRKKLTETNYIAEHYDIIQKSRYVNGLAWNYFIANQIDLDLHTKLLEVSYTEVLAFSNVLNALTLIRSGYFYTARQVINNIDLTGHAKLQEIQTWLLNVLREADDTLEENQ